MNQKKEGEESGSLIQIYEGNKMKYRFITKTQRYNETWLQLINGKCWNCIHAKWKQTSSNVANLSLRKGMIATHLLELCYNEDQGPFYHQEAMINPKHPKS